MLPRTAGARLLTGAATGARSVAANGFEQAVCGGEGLADEIVPGLVVAGAGEYQQIRRRNGAAAGGARSVRRDGARVLGMLEHPARAVGRVVLVAPAEQVANDGPQAQALVGQDVLSVAVAAPHLLEHAGLTQGLQALGEYGARHPQVRGEVAEAAHAEERVAHDQQRPALADDLESARERAPLSRVILGQSHSPDAISNSSLTELACA